MTEQAAHMILEIPDERLNPAIRRWLRRLIDRAEHASYANITVRRSGLDEKFEADWVKYLTIKVE